MLTGVSFGVLMLIALLCTVHVLTSLHGGCVSGQTLSILTSPYLRQHGRKGGLLSILSLTCRCDVICSEKEVKSQYLAYRDLSKCRNGLISWFSKWNRKSNLRSTCMLILAFHLCCCIALPTAPMLSGLSAAWQFGPLCILFWGNMCRYLYIVYI